MIDYVLCIYCLLNCITCMQFQSNLNIKIHFKKVSTFSLLKLVHIHLRHVIYDREFERRKLSVSRLLYDVCRKMVNVNAIRIDLQMFCGRPAL